MLLSINEFGNSTAYKYLLYIFGGCKVSHGKFSSLLFSVKHDVPYYKVISLINEFRIFLFIISP